jgi:hypothetical protein
MMEASLMTFRATQFSGIACLLVGAVLAAPLYGCGGGQLGSELTVRPEPQPLGGGAGSVLHLPADRQYSIALAPTQESPELDGTAEADAQASKDGSASAVAQVVNAGKATAGFQLGYSVKNESDRQTALKIRVRCEHEISVRSDPPSATPDAKTSLTLYARDQYNRLLRTIELARDDSNDGAATSGGRTDAEFELLLGPGDTVSIFLAGSVQIDTRRGRTARGEVKMTGLEMDIETIAAPPVKKIADEQG